MAKKSFSPFKIWNSYVWGFIFATTYIFLLIASNMIFGTVDDSIAMCLENCQNFEEPQLTMCQEQCNQISETVGRFQFLEGFKDVPTPSIVLCTGGLFVVGFIFGWGLGSLKKVIEG